MSKYTTEVRFICESEAGLSESKGYSSIDEILEAAIPKIFSFQFPMFDEAYRTTLCKKILKHYYTREIGEETYGLWKLRLDMKMNEIMPYYNQLYASEVRNLNPLYDVDYTRTYTKKDDGSRGDNFTETRNGWSIGDRNFTDTGSQKTETSETDKKNGSTSGSSTGESRSNGTAHSADTAHSQNDGSEKNLYSDTPNTNLSGFESGDYLTNARAITNGSTTDSNAASDSTVNNTENSKENHSETTKDDRERKGKTEHSSESQSIRHSSDSNGDVSTNIGERKINNLQEYTEHVKGKMFNNNYGKMLKDFRDSFLRIDEEIIKELSPLFMNLW